MRSQYFLCAILVLPATCYLYLNHTEVESNSETCNTTVDFYSDATGQCVVNGTFITFVTITKLRIYFKINIAEDQNDKEFRKVFLSSVFEVDKVFKGKQSNLIINAFFSAVRNSMAFEYKMPLPPVSMVACTEQHNKNHCFITGNIQIRQLDRRYFFCCLSSGNTRRDYTSICRKSERK